MGCSERWQRRGDPHAVSTELSGLVLRFFCCRYFSVLVLVRACSVMRALWWWVVVVMNR